MMRFTNVCLASWDRDEKAALLVMDYCMNAPERMGYPFHEPYLAGASALSISAAMRSPKVI